MQRLVLIIIIALTLWSCASRKPKGGFDEIADFGLTAEPSGTRVDDKAYFDDLKRSEGSVSFESSLPLPLMVGKTGDPFDAIPPGAKQSLDSRLIVQMGPCHFTLLTGAMQVDRYLLAGQWIKLTEGLPAKTPVKLEPNMDLNLKVISKLSVEISDSQISTCRKMFEGKKVLLGRFHLNKSKIGLIPGPRSPKVQFGSRSVEPHGKIIFIHWQPGSNAPLLIDDFDFPATAESGIFRAQMSNKGYYYLAFQSVLRMDQVDQMILKLPYPSGPQQMQPSTKKPQGPIKPQAPVKVKLR
ncbi:MAG: hypothetical protein H7249_03985 [Chitinophagaceae bacterium]|nr:hypothetical protein [Oligoflexus sp.]